MEQKIQQQTQTYLYEVELGHAKESASHVVIIKSLKVRSDDPTKLIEMINGLSHQMIQVVNRMNGE
jgi:hypothetical protein